MFCSITQGILQLLSLCIATGSGLIAQRCVLCFQTSSLQGAGASGASRPNTPADAPQHEAAAAPAAAGARQSMPVSKPASQPQAAMGSAAAASASAGTAKPAAGQRGSAGSSAPERTSKGEGMARPAADSLKASCQRCRPCSETSIYHARGDRNHCASLGTGASAPGAQG